LIREPQYDLALAEEFSTVIVVVVKQVETSRNEAFLNHIEFIGFATFFQSFNECLQGVLRLSEGLDPS